MNSVDNPAAGAVDPTDVAAVQAQLGRAPRGLRAVAHRCPCGNPDVVETAPRIKTERNPDGEPFPTLYYLTCPKAAAAIGTLEGGGLMAEMTERLRTDPELAAGYRAAHEDYLRRRDAIEILPGFPSAGGMPDRVKCLHVLVAHALAAGPGVNPLGDEALALLPEWWRTGPCVWRDESPDGVPDGAVRDAVDGAAEAGREIAGPDGARQQNGDQDEGNR